MAASARFRHLRRIALFASLMTITAAPAFAQTLSYQPVDRGLGFPQYAPQAQQQNDATQSTDEMPAAFRRQVVSYQGNEAAGTVIVDTAHTYLYLVLGGGKALRYGIGVGREGFTWSGTQTITRKAEWPDWIPPAAMIARQPYLPRWVGGGPGNPLGARAMYLGNTDFRIHGTNDPTTIGKHVSSGCIRLANDDVIDLYSRINVGTKVVVLPNDDRNAAVEGGRRASLGAPMTAQIQVRPAAERPQVQASTTSPMRLSILGISLSRTD
jgi:lipoprotein-anchoring transpeptidase ErfK/SrfK